MSSLLSKILFGDAPKFPDTRRAKTEDIAALAKRLGELWLGQPGSGKTWTLARGSVDHLIEHPDEPMISFDANQNFTDAFLTIVLSQPKEIRDSLIKRIIYDELGHPKRVLTLPEFHVDYEVPMEKQTARAIQNFQALNPELITETPIMGGASVKDYGGELFRLLTVIPNEFGSTFQITEAKRLLTDRKLLSQKLKDFGKYAGNAKWFYENNYTKLPADEAYKRVLGLISVLNDIEAPEIRPRVGYHRPSYTMPQIIKEGKILLVNGHRINDQERTLSYLLIQVKSLLMNEIVKRTPNNPKDPPVTLIFDEVPAIIGLPSMSKEISRLSTYFRSRKLQPIIVAQELSQFSEELRPHIWGYANVVVFSMLNFDDRVEIAQQLFPYIPETIKVQGKTSSQPNLYEPDRGQYLQIANEIYNMKHRECIVRRQNSEHEANNELVWVKRTKEALATATPQEVQELKDELLEKYGERVDEVTASINRRIMDKGDGNVEPPNRGRTKD